MRRRDEGAITRLRRVGAWLRIFTIATSGGWVALLLLGIFAPVGEWVAASRGFIGPMLVIVYMLGAWLSMIVYWIVTGVNALDVLMGFAVLPDRPRPNGGCSNKTR